MLVVRGGCRDIVIGVDQIAHINMEAGMSEEREIQRDDGMGKLLVAPRDGGFPLQAPAALEVHPYATLFPLMEGDELSALASDIAKNGLQMPIVLLDNQILDGRNRHAACIEAGIKPAFELYRGDDPLGYVLSLNLHRRHLTESQRGMIASGLATMSQGARTDIAQICAMSQTQAAARLNVSRRTVQHATVVRERGIPELGRRVERGEINISLAAKVARMPEEQQTAVAVLPAGALRVTVKNAALIEPDIARSTTKGSVTDFVVWCNEQAGLLRAAPHTKIKLQIDWENVAGKIESLGSNYSRDLAGNLFKVLKHLIQMDLATEEHRGRKCWHDKINEARGEIRRLLASAPSLRQTIQAAIAESLGPAKEAALKGMQVSERRVIELDRLSYREEQVINDWFPTPPPQLTADSHDAERAAVAAAKKVGLKAYKGPLLRNVLGGFRLVDHSGAVIAGNRFDLTAQRVLEICADRAGMA
jgi:hypothetical protein